jgi:hypothetical protein
VEFGGEMMIADRSGEETGIPIGELDRIEGDSQSVVALL